MAHVWQPLPVGASRCAWWQPPVILTGTVTAAPLPQRHLCRPAYRPASSQAPCVPVRSPPFHVPSVAAAATHAERLPHRRARAAAAVPPGRGLCAWIHAPARTPAVIAGCRHAAPAQHQCMLPRRGRPRSRIRTPTRHERASPHPSRKCR